MDQNYDKEAQSDGGRVEQLHSLTVEIQVANRVEVTPGWWMRAKGRATVRRCERRERRGDEDEVQQRKDGDGREDEEVEGARAWFVMR